MHHTLLDKSTIYYRPLFYAAFSLRGILCTMKTIYVAIAATLCTSLSLAACADKPQISPSDLPSVESSIAKDSNQASTLADKAAKAGVPVALAEAWEREGVHIADNGSVYSDTCPASRKLHIPPGVTIRC